MPYLKSIAIDNDNILKNISISFEHKYTIIRAKNGGGKTTLFNTIKNGTYAGRGNFNLEINGVLGDLKKYYALIFIDEDFSYKNCYEIFNPDIYKNIFEDALFIKMFNEHLKEFNFFPWKEKNTIDNFQDLFSGSYNHTEEILMKLVALYSLRNYLKIEAPLIFDNSISILDSAAKRLAFEVIDKISKQVILFENFSTLDFPDKFSADNLCIKTLELKSI
jgi:hypothetical protein